MTRARDVANLIGSGNYSSTTFTATAGQTAFTISHTQGFVQVFMNGLLLDETVDYTSNGSAITLTSGAAAGDEIEVVAYNTFSVGDALPKSGGAMTGALDMNGAEIVLDADGDTSITSDTDDHIDFKTAGTDRLKITTDKVQFNVDAKVDSDNARDLGSGGARWKDLYLGGGAYIGGTGASNKLDDYEEGVFTPGVSHGSLGSGSYGKYTKIGNQVTVFVQIDNGSNTSTASELYITGLPFTAISPNTTGHAGNGAVSYTYNMPDVISAVANSNNTRVFFSQTNSSNLTFAETTGSWSIRFTISYQTNS